MKFSRLLAIFFFFCACQPAILPTVVIIDNNKIITLQTDERISSKILNQTGITLNRNDRVLLNGLPTTLDQPITIYPVTLQTRRAVIFTLVTADGEQKLNSSAFTIGETLQDSSLWLHAGDEIQPGSDTPIQDGM